jgi:HD superfamily phosphohydrolase
MHDKRFIRDALHGDIELPDDARLIIDTQTFQRLRYIQQLATCHYVFPSATHSRFSHSVGAFHLARKLIDNLRQKHPHLISDEDARLVPIAALLHDVGHPPFSHMFETPEVFATFAHHEEWGLRIMTDPECDLSQVLSLLLGESLPRLIAIMDGTVEKPFLHEIVSSQLDVDRLDYLLRDQSCTGADVGGFDHERLLRSLGVSEDGHLVVGLDSVGAVEAYLVTRWHMYQLVYFHKLNMLTQAYYVRALKRARELHENGDLPLSLKMRDMLSNRELTPLRYAGLTDSFVIADVFQWAGHDDPVLSNCARRLSSRDDFHKRIRLELTKEQAELLMGPLREVVSAAGFDGKEDVIHTPLQKEGYLPYEAGIHLDDGRDIMEASKMIESISGEFSRSMVFVPRSVRDECEELAKRLLKLD